MPRLEFDRLVMDLGRACMKLRLGSMLGGRIGVRSVLCLAVRLALVRQRSSFAVPRSLLTRSGLTGLIPIVHTCPVPCTLPRNQLVH
jgi:hypothetical protein